jgi:hypothetical protein
MEEEYEVYTISFDTNPSDIDHEKDFIINSGLSSVSKKFLSFLVQKILKSKLERL